MSVHLRFIFWIAVFIALLPVQIGWIYLLRGPAMLDHDALLIGGQAVLGLAVIAALVLLRTTPTDAIRLPRRWSTIVILAGTGLLQLAAAAMLWPGLSEDCIRYRMDGGTWLHGQSPWSSAPEQVFSSARWPDAIDRLTPYPQLHSVYPPIAQACSTVCRWIEDRIAGQAEFPAITRTAQVTATDRSDWRAALPALSPWHRALIFRLTFGVCVIVTTALLLRWLAVAGQSPWQAVLFAWHPLVTLEFGGMGHVDALGILLLIAAILTLKLARPAASGVLLALAVGVKPWAVVLLPFLLIGPGKRAITFTVGFFIALTILFAPPLLFHHGYRGWFETLRICSLHWEANGLIFDLQKYVFGQGDYGFAMVHAKASAKQLGLIVAGIALTLALLCRSGPAVGGYVVYLIALLFAPVVYPWYLAWALLLTPMMRTGGWTILTWAATVGISYRLWRTPNWTLPWSILWIEYIPVFAAGVLEVALLFRRHSSSRSE